MKPAQNFGLAESVLEQINQLCRQKEVVLYVFGNPYVIKHIPLDKFKSVWAVFQDFSEFQKNAARHFLGEIDARGKLPVTIEPR